MEAIKNRYEFVILFDVENGNPNGDPDAGNMPRIDPETGYGIVSDVCLKRKVRNYIELAKENTQGFDIYIKEKAILNEQNKKAYTALDMKPESKKLPKKEEDARAVTKWMCENFFDIRTFGAVMTTDINCGQVRGPVQINFAKSIDVVVPQEISITRMAVTTQAESDKQQGGNRTMGRKYIVPYALYRAEGYVSAPLAEKTNFTDADLQSLWEALENMFEHDHSAARGKMSVRKLIIFKHECKLGNAKAHELFDKVQVAKNPDVTVARAYSDYTVTIDKTLPNGVELQEIA